jgi:hypothetical protein
MTSLVAVACFRPGRAKDLSAHPCSVEGNLIHIKLSLFFFIVISRLSSVGSCHRQDIFVASLKADSHRACRTHAVPIPFPCHAVPLIHTCHAAPMPCSESAVSFMKVRVVAGNIRTASPTVQKIVFFVLCYYHYLQSWVWIVVMGIGMLLITIFVELRVEAGRSRTRAGSPQAVSRRSCCAMALRRTAWTE